MKTHLALTLVTSTTALMSLGSILGQTSPTRPIRASYTFEELDANRDGKLNLGEFAMPQIEANNARFTRLDKNADGRLSREEFEAPPRFGELPTRPVNDFGKADANGDKAVTLEEYTAALKPVEQARLDLRDKDKDEGMSLPIVLETDRVTREQFATRPRVKHTPLPEFRVRLGEGLGVLRHAENREVTCH